MIFDSVEFRKVGEEDATSLLNLKKESWQSTHKTTINNLEDQIKWIRSMDGDIHFPSSLMLTAASRDVIQNDTLIKFGIFKISNIDWVSRSADVGWDVYSIYRKKGFGKRLVQAGKKYCFQGLGLRRLTCEILSNNEPSMKCAIAAGFQLEGTKRQAIFKNGIYLDSQVFGLLSPTTGV